MNLSNTLEYTVEITVLVDQVSKEAGILRSSYHNHEKIHISGHDGQYIVCGMENECLPKKIVSSFTLRSVGLNDHHAG